MRIQHNIMAMSAYRNYTANVSAMKSNLEKLSSGYKINRAGDDAAGLAISEKMRAQITGLETAQKNAKDGISLVQTAEGALTEVHDMLNRMVELATQSANGTYDNETDRAQLQKEMDQLKEEINRIADSSNFNGIQLLDGSMDSSPIPGDLTNIQIAAAGADDPALPEVGQILGKDTVLHKGASEATNAQFGFSLHNVTYSNDDPNGFISIKIGDDEIKLSGGASKAELDTSDIISGATNVREMQVGTRSYNVEGSTLEEQLTSWVNQFNSDSTANSAGAITAAVKGSTIEFTSTEVEQGATVGNALSVGGNTLSGGADAVAQKNTGTVALGSAIANGDVIKIGDTEYHFFTDATAQTAANFTAGAGQEAVLLDSTTADAAWVAGKLIAAGAFEIDGFQSPSNVSGASFDIEAVNKEAATSANRLGAGDVSTDLSAFVSGANASKVSVSYAQTTAGVDGKAASYNSGAMTRLDGKLTIGDGTYTVSSTDLKDQINEFITQYNADKTKNYTASWNDTGDGVLFTAKEAGVTGVTTLGAVNTATGTDGTDSAIGTNDAMDAKAILDAIMSGKATINGTALTQDMLASGVTLTASDNAKYTVSVENGYTLTFTQVDGDTATATLDREVTIAGSDGDINDSALVKGDYQKSTTYNEPNAASTGNRLASTYFSLTEDMVADTASIFIGGTNYTFTTDAAAAKDDSTKVYIGDMLDDEGKLTADLTAVAERISVAARDNEVYTVGYDKNRLTFTERPDYTTGEQEYDLTQKSEIERSLGYTGPETPSKGKSLTLQIGDTAADYNQLKVDIKDCHTKAMGLDDISIADQESAAAAVDAIKNAINYVSDVRGTLGATQNRLDHTINNLSVMTENIQDAESTIRDVDVAEEMMAYTKNNILIQASQAMLAQANQVPQGVLQLLQ